MLHVIFRWWRQRRIRRAGVRTITFPWEPHGSFSANLAIGDLRENLLKLLKTEKGIHAETLMMVIGAIAGHSAIHALWASVNRPSTEIKIEGLHIVQTGDGRRFYVGDPLNAFLVHEKNSVLPLWGFLAAAMIECGASKSQLPDFREMFAHVARTISSGTFGALRAPADHRPMWSPLDALTVFWPVARTLLMSDKAPMGDRKPVAVEHWPIIAGIVAKQLVVATKDVLDPRLSVSICMESAILMSKVDPLTIPQELPPPRATT